VLFDEIEKAHEDVWSLLLQILDDGHLTDSAGRKVDFRNTLIVMTSNVGAKAIAAARAPLGFGTGVHGSETEMRRQVLEELRATFKPEFLGRIDETIVFHRLGEEEMLGVTRNLLADALSRFAAAGLELTVPEETARFLASRGYDEASGARPLRRLIQSQLEDKVAELLLSGGIRPGDALTARLEDGEIRLENDKRKE